MDGQRAVAAPEATHRRGNHGQRRRPPSLSPPQVGRLLGHAALKQGDLVQVRHGDVPDDVRQALVQQREDDDVQRRPLGLETEPERGVSRAGPSPAPRCRRAEERPEGRAGSGSLGGGVGVAIAASRPAAEAPLGQQGNGGLNRRRGDTHAAAGPGAAPAGAGGGDKGRTPTPEGHTLPRRVSSQPCRLGAAAAVTALPALRGARARPQGQKVGALCPRARALC